MTQYQTAIRVTRTRNNYRLESAAVRLQRVAAALKPSPDDKLLSRAVNGILGFGLTNIDRPDAAWVRTHNL